MSLLPWTRSTTHRLVKLIQDPKWDPFRQFEVGNQTFAAAAMGVIDRLIEELKRRGAPTAPPSMSADVRETLRVALAERRDLEEIVKELLDEAEDEQAELDGDDSGEGA